MYVVQFALTKKDQKNVVRLSYKSKNVVINILSLKKSLNSTQFLLSWPINFRNLNVFKDDAFANFLYQNSLATFITSIVR